MRKFWTKLFSPKCEHLETVVVTSVGVRRVVCEGCGNLSFFMAPALTLRGEVRGQPELPRASGL